MLNIPSSCSVIGCPKKCGKQLPRCDWLLTFQDLEYAYSCSVIGCLPFEVSNMPRSCSIIGSMIGINLLHDWLLTFWHVKYFKFLLYDWLLTFWGVKYTQVLLRDVPRIPLPLEHGIGGSPVVKDRQKRGGVSHFGCRHITHVQIRLFQKLFASFFQTRSLVQLICDLSGGLLPFLERQKGICNWWYCQILTEIAPKDTRGI